MRCTREIGKRLVWIITSTEIKLPNGDGDIVDELWCETFAQAASCAESALDGAELGKKLSISVCEKSDTQIMEIGLEPAGFRLAP